LPELGIHAPLSLPACFAAALKVSSSSLPALLLRSC
jgi:hypothetical protein